MTKPPPHARTALEVVLPPSEFAYCLIEPLCASGELRCWARRGARDGPWEEFWAAEWTEELRLISPDCIVRMELVREERRVQQDGRTILVLEERLRATEIWFSPVFAPAGPPPTDEQVFKEWLAALEGRPYPARPAARAALKGKLTSRAVDKLWSDNNPRNRGRQPT